MQAAEAKAPFWRCMGELLGFLVILLMLQEFARRIKGLLRSFGRRGGRFVAAPVKVLPTHADNIPGRRGVFISKACDHS